MYRNKKILELVRQSPCQNCGIENGTIVAAHSNQLRDGKGKSIKAHDFRIAALCHRCHHDVDASASMSRAEKLAVWEEAHRKTIGWLFLNDHMEIK